MFVAKQMNQKKEIFTIFLYIKVSTDGGYGSIHDDGTVPI